MAEPVLPERSRAKISPSSSRTSAEASPGALIVVGSAGSNTAIQFSSPST
jgi:hypothetical protein